MRLPDKSAVREALRTALERALAAMAASAGESQRGATHEESRAEGDKDMRSTEQSYLARGQSMRAEEIADELGRLAQLVPRAFGEDDAIAADALVGVRVDDVPRVFYVVPFGGGTELELEGTRVTVVTPASPVGAALSGRREGDELELMIRGAKREWSIERVR